uniref:FACT complex subunit SPT16 middle domain-containing protein n=1 Tax=Lygus hesperus TaxID=30085 RepID=A0A0A9W3Z9_LYGHE
MTVIFHSLQEANIGYKLNRTKVFLKELTYSSTQDVFSEVQSAVQACQQRIKNDDVARKREVSTAGFHKLTLIPNALRLPQVKMRPPISVGRLSKTCVGNL